MNRRTSICLLAAALAARGQPPQPASPPPAEVTTTTSQSTTTTTTSVEPSTTTTTPPPRVATTTTTEPPPPPPKPPDRWVLTDTLRKSIESQTGRPFAEAWGRIGGQVAEVCPDKFLCANHALVVDPTSDLTDDCVIVPGGISVPNPLHENGTITFRVDNDTNCAGA